MPGLVPGIHALTAMRKKVVDGWDKLGHDKFKEKFDGEYLCAKWSRSCASRPAPA